MDRIQDWKHVGMFEGFKKRIKGCRNKERGWMDTGGRMEGYREKDGRIQGEGWKDTGKRMEGYREKDGRRQGEGLKDAWPKMEINRKKYGGIQGEGWEPRAENFRMKYPDILSNN